MPDIIVQIRMKGIIFGWIIIRLSVPTSSDGCHNRTGTMLTQEKLILENQPSEAERRYLQDSQIWLNSLLHLFLNIVKVNDESTAVEGASHKARMGHSLARPCSLHWLQSMSSKVDVMEALAPVGCLIVHLCSLLQCCRALFRSIGCTLLIAVVVCVSKDFH